MKKFLTVLIGASYAWASYAQNVGIGTADPVAKLDVAGEVKIGNTTNANPAPGTMRWNADKNDFEGYNGKAWVSLTGGKNGWGNQHSYSHENEATYLELDNNNGNRGHGLGNAVAVSGNMVLAGASYDNRSDTFASGSAILFTRNEVGWIIRTKLVDPGNYHNGDHFGKSVALIPTHLAVGAPGYRTNGIRKGKVFVYTYNTSGVGQPAGIAPTNGTENEEFGFSLSLEGTYLATGARSAKVGSNDYQGRAFVFLRSSIGWVQQATLTAPDGQASDNFGYAISLSGNYVAVGAPFAKPNGVNSAGKVYIYQRSGSQWTQTTLLTPPSLPPGHSFGFSLHLKNDTLVVGASGWNNANWRRGKVYVYVRNEANWELKATLAPADSQATDLFAASLHYSNDRIIVGSIASVGATRQQGKAYIYKKAGTGWVEEAILTASQGATGDAFGTGVAISPEAAVVGAPNAALRSLLANGRVYFFNR
jgi:hypothetical protein